jgi:CHASE3 domain sensor protein
LIKNNRNKYGLDAENDLKLTENVDIESQLQSYLLTNNHNLVEKVTKENAMEVSG